MGGNKRRPAPVSAAEPDSNDAGIAATIPLDSRGTRHDSVVADTDLDDIRVDTSRSLPPELEP